MKLIISWWSWKDGRHQKTIALPKIRNGYISKRAWQRFEAGIKDLDGKKVRVKIKEDADDGRNTIQTGGTAAAEHGSPGTGRGPYNLRQYAH